MTSTTSGRYAQAIAASRRIRWDIDADVLRGRALDFSRPFLPEGLARVEGLTFLEPAERLRLNQVQGRTYAAMFGLVERFIGIKMLEVSSAHWFGDQVALEALVRFTDEELKHQELFRRVEALAGAGMPKGYQFVPVANDVAARVLQASTWAVLALTCHIELFTQVHYRHSIEPQDGLDPLYKDVFLFHWKEESQHALIDELEWQREDRGLREDERDAAVADLVGLVQAIDALLQRQAVSDAQYFLTTTRRTQDEERAALVFRALLDAYRWQYIGSGVVPDGRFAQLLATLAGPARMPRIQSALAPLLA